MKKIVSLCALLSLAGSLLSQTVWTGTADNNYNNAANWTIGLPTTGSTATVPAAPTSGVQPSILVPTTIDYSLLNEGTISNFSTIINANLIENNGSIANFGAGEINNNAGATLVNLPSGIINSAASITTAGELINDGNILNCALLENTGQLLNNGFINFNGGTLDNQNDFDNLGDLTINASLLNSGNLTNDGNINVTSLGSINNAGTINNNFIFDNAGTIVNSGTIINNFVLINNFGATLNNSNNGQVINAACSSFRQLTANPVLCLSPGPECGFINNGILYQIPGAGNIDNLSGPGVVLNNINIFPNPDAQCQDITRPLDANGFAVITHDQIDNGSTADYCFIDSIWLSTDTFTCANIGANPVTLFVRDGLGTTSSCVATVMIEDQTAPEITCPTDITLTLDPGACEAFVYFADATATDNCQLSSLLRTDGSGLNSGDVFPRGTTTIAFEASDGTNTASCSFNIVVEEYPFPTNGINCNNGVQISLDANCEAVIGADDILEGGPYGCFDDFIVELFYDENLMQPIPSSPMVTVADINKTLWAMITNPDNGNACWGWFTVEDKQVPELECTTYEFACTQSVLPQLGGTPGFPISAPANPFQTNAQTGTTQYSLSNFDGCGDALLTYSDWIDDIDCRLDFSNAYTKIIYRTWTVTDEQGNSTQCIDTLQLLRATLTDLIPPPNYDDSNQAALLCEDKEPRPPNEFCGGLVGWNAIESGDFAGHPSPFEERYFCGNIKWSGTGVPQGIDCGNIHFSFADVRVNVCQEGTSEGCYKILREWTIIDWCNGDINQFTQLIKVSDKQGPTINDIEDVTISTDAWVCTANWYLPAPWIMDNCSDIDGSYTLTASAGTVQYLDNIDRYYLSGLPLGNHEVKVRAVDCCGNATEESITLSVEDLVPPNVVCEVFHTTSLTIDGTAKVLASSLDDGSSDACGPVYFKTIRMEDLLGTDHGSTSNQALTDCDQLNGDDSNKFGTQIFFDDYAKFCCEDIDHNNQLVLRVFDKDPGSGPVDPNRMRPGGDLAGHFNDCMVEMTVNDYLPPFIQCPDDLTVSCDFWFDRNDLGSVFGEIKFDASEVEYLLINDRVCPGHPLYDPANPNQAYEINLGQDGLAGDNCGLTITENVVDNLNCGKGVLTRIFTATDMEGRTASCVQRITIVDCAPYDISDTNCFNFDPFDGVRWPCDFSTTSCGAATEPVVTGVPQIFNDDLCTLISVTHDDETFPIVLDACFKIKRIWTITDWCTFDEFDTDNNDIYDPTDDGIIAGQWEYVQYVKVLNSTAPEWETCEDLTIDSYHSDCSGIISLNNTLSDDCTPGELLLVDFKIDLDNDGVYDYLGANVSPYPHPNPQGLALINLSYSDADADGVFELSTAATELPLGQHRILWNAEDVCSNLGTCEYLFTVVDKAKPTPKAFNGLAVDVQAVTEEVVVSAIMLDAGSFDNCGVQTLRIAHPSGGPGQTIPPSTEEVIFTCDDLGLQPIDLWVLDVNDNWDYVSSYVEVQNNLGACTVTTGASIAGSVDMENGEAVESVSVNLTGNVPGIPDFYLTGETGAYQFSNLPMHYDYTLRPTRTGDVRNGISTLDIILISRHLVGLNRLTSPYQWIAADTDNSGSINTFDIITLQKMILYLIDEFPNNESWRFVDANFVFDSGVDPFSSPFPEVFAVADLAGAVIGDFVAVKVGDVSGNAKPADLTGSNSGARSFSGLLPFVVDEAVLEAGEEYIASFKAKDFIGILGYQFTLGFDLEALELVDYEAGHLPGLSKANFGGAVLAEGMITSSWSIKEALPIEEGTELFQLTFKAKKATILSEALSLHSRYTNAEAYAQNLENPSAALDVLDLAIEFRGDAESILVQNQTALFQNQPNPFIDQTLIGFTLMEDGPASLTIYSAEGVERKRFSGDYKKGYHEVNISREDLGASGIYIYQLEQDGRKRVRKMVMLE